MDAYKQATRLVADLQKVLVGLEESGRIRERQEAQHRADTAAWGRERIETAKRLQDQAAAIQELRQELERRSQALQGAEQAVGQLRQAVQQAEEQSKIQATQASQAIRAAEYLQGELNNAKAALQQRQSQGQGGVQTGPLRFDGPTIPSFLQNGFSTNLPAGGGAPQQHLQQQHQPQQQQHQHQHQHHQQPGYQQLAGPDVGQGGGLAPSDPRRPAQSGQHGMNGNAHLGLQAQKRKPDIPLLGGPPPKQAAYGANANAGPGYQHANPQAYHQAAGMQAQPRPEGPRHSQPQLQPHGPSGGVASGPMSAGAQYSVHAPSSAVRPPPAGVASSSRQILLQNLPYAMGEAEVRELAGSSRNGPGAVSRVEVERMQDGRSKGVAVAVFADPRAAEHAIQDLNCRQVGGRTISAALDRRAPGMAGKA